MKCPRCKFEWKAEGQQRAGKTKNPNKGFGTRRVLDKALATIKRRVENNQK